MAKEVKPIQVNTADLVAKAVDKSGNAVYANHAQFSIGPNEINIDLFLLGSSPTESSVPQAIFVKRIIIPLTLVKGFVSGLANLILRFENDTDTKIPNTREPQPDDVMEIWK